MSGANNILKILLIVSLSASVISCSSEMSLGENRKANGGVDCFATGATVANTLEGSGIALFYDKTLYPGNSNQNTPWTFINPTALSLKEAPKFNFLSCSNLYQKIIDIVISQDRNKSGSLNTGVTERYEDLRVAIASATAPFVGLDTFYFSAKSLGVTVSTGLTEVIFKENLKKKCSGTVNGKDLYDTDVCPNGTYMHNFLWRKDGLFVNNPGAKFSGVIPSSPQPDKRYASGFNPGLTWTRGYLLNTYSNHKNSTPFYTAIFDAGSSGTRISLYRVKPSLPGGKAVVSALFTKYFDDEGINDFMSNKGEVDVSVLPDKKLPNGCTKVNGLGQDDVGPCVLQPLLNYLTLKLPAGVKPGDVKIELFSTAGMRTEDRKNGGAFTSTQIENFYNNKLKQYVRSTALRDGAIYSHVGEFKTINGNSEEGVWTWINLNDVYYDTFSHKGRCGDAPIGDIEVGGSSMQIAFPTKEPPDEAKNIYNVNINGCSINVFSKTFLGLGSDDARKFMRAFNY